MNTDRETVQRLKRAALHAFARLRAGLESTREEVARRDVNTFLERLRRRLDRFYARLAHTSVPVLSPGLNLLVVGGLAATCLMQSVSPPLSERYPLSATRAPHAGRQLVLLAADGDPFARRGTCIASPVRLEELPPHFLDALLSMEDRRFYEHLGVDLIGILRAAKRNIEEGHIVQGGSTITQQLAKMSYLSGAQTFARKLEEAFIALRLEAALSKDEILERYLSSAYFGRGCHGLRAAAREYFDKPVGELTLTESAYLVGILRAPSTLAANPEAAKRRARLVLSAMAAAGRLSTEAAKNAGIATPQQEDDGAGELGGYYADWIARTVEPQPGGDMSPLAVRTTFDPQLQKIAETAVANIMDKAGQDRNAEQAALVAMRPDGRVVAMVGGRDYARSHFNRATQALRQPGSAFKMFVYLAALRGGVDTDLLVPDRPLRIGDWSPENYEHEYRGAVTVEDAFVSSINTVAVRLSETLGRSHVIETARDLGLTTPLTHTPSLALGASEVTLLELTSAYAAISADAYPVKPWGVRALGRQSRGDPPPGAGRWQLEEGGVMRHLLAATVNHGTGHRARLPIPAYGKTGTSQAYRDAWFLGFAGNLVVGVWVGNDDNSSMNHVTGGSLPARIWHEFLDAARRKDPDFTQDRPRIATFPARPRNSRHFAVAWDSLEVRQAHERYWRRDRRFVSEGFWSSYGPRPSMFGPAQPSAEGRRARDRRSRERGNRGTRKPYWMPDGMEW